MGVLDPSNLTIFKDSALGVAFVSLLLMVGYMVRAYSAIRVKDMDAYKSERELDRKERRDDRIALDTIVSRFEESQRRSESHNHDIFDRVLTVTGEVVEAVGELKTAVHDNAEATGHLSRAVEDNAKVVGGLKSIVDNLQSTVTDMRQDRRDDKIEEKRQQALDKPKA